jgi:hypothetical protein
MQKTTSRKISYLQFVSALMVIAQHTVFATYFQVDGGWLERLHIWARDLNDGAVSTFFFLSAVLLMRSAGKHSWGQIMLRKLKAIALPYALWIVIYTAARIVRGSVAAGALLLPGFKEMVQWVLTGPEYYIFWFLRVLLVLTALYPVLMWAVRLRWPALALMILCPVLVLAPGMGAWIPFESIVYWLPPFLLGCWVGMEKMPQMEKYPVSRKWWVYALCLLLFLLTGWLRRVSDLFYYSFWSTAPFLLWVLADSLAGLPSPPWWVNASFFMYCCHMLVERYAVKVHLFLFGAGKKSFVLSHVSLPVITAVMVLVLAAVLRYALPGVYALITGLRRPEHQKGKK